MAESVLKLKVDSQEYDQKIKRAAEGIQQYAQKCRDVGGTLQYLDDGVLEFVQAIGKMDTVATGTKQQLREMSNALTTLTQTYRGLTDEEKASPFGQELAKGIQQLTERAGQAQDAMADVQASIRNAASDTRVFDQLAQGASVATAGFQGLTGAGKLLGIEMGNDVEVIAKLQAAMAVTNSLTTIQTALQEQSALMQGVQAVQAAAATAAQKLLAASTGDAARAQAAYNAVASANPYMILVGAIGAVVGAMSLLSSGSEEVTSSIDETRRAIDDASRSAEYYISIAQQLGAGRKAINEMRLTNAKGSMETASVNRQQAEQRLKDAMTSGNFSELGALKKNLEDAQKLEQEATQKYLDVRRDIGQQQEIERQLLANWDNLNTEKEINVAISKFRDFRSEVEQGSAAWQMYDNKISVLQEKLNSFKSSNVKTGSPSNTTAKYDIIYPEGSIGALEKELSDLKKAEKLVTDNDGWVDLGRRIDDVKNKISLLKGELPKDKVAVFSLKANAHEVVSQLENIEGLSISDKIFEVTVDDDETMEKLLGIDEVTIAPKDVMVIVSDAEAIGALESIEDIIIRDKTFTVIAETDGATDELAQIDGVHFDPKTLTVLFDDADAMSKAQQINGLTFEAKSVNVTADTREALQSLLKLDGVSIADKTFSIQADSKTAIDKLLQIDGVLDPKTLTVTLQDADVLKKVQAINGISFLSKSLSVTADTQEAVRQIENIDGLSISDKSFDVTVSDSETMEKLLGIDEVTIDPKEVMVTVSDAETIGALESIEDIIIRDKTFTVIAETDGATDELAQIDGVHFDPKTLTVLFDDADAMSKAQQINGLTFEAKSVNVTAETQEALQSLLKLDGVSIADKTFSIQADSKTAIDKLLQIDGVLDPKTLTVTLQDADVLKKVQDINGLSFSPKSLSVTAETQEAFRQLENIDGLSISDKIFEVTVSDADVMEKLLGIDEVTIDPKEVMVTVSDAEAIGALESIENIIINDKTFSVIAETDGATDELAQIDGVRFDPKTLTVLFDDAEAMSKAQQINGLTFEAKSVNVTAETQEALQNLLKLDGVSIDNKTFEVKADTLDAINEMMQLNGLHLEPKKLTVILDSDVQEKLRQTSDKKVVISPQFAELEEKLKDIKNVKVDPISMTITADTTEAMKAVNDAAKGIDGLSVSFEVKPEIKDVKELQKGLSGSSKNTFDWLRSTKQTKMNNAEIGSIEYANSYASLIDVTTVESLLNAAFKNNITISDDTKESLLQQLVDGNNIPASTFDTLIATINEQLKQKNLDPLSIDVNTGEVKQGKVIKEMTNFTDKMSKALGGISSIFGGVERMGIKLDDGIKDAIDTIQGVMQIIQGVQTVIQVVQGTELAANTAALTLLTAALYANTYASLIPGMAGGGIAKAANGFIGGNEHTDAIPVLVQSGELILNKAQQGNLASQLQDGKGGNNAMRVVGEIQGEKIVLVANRFLKRTGQGELVTWKD